MPGRPAMLSTRSRSVVQQVLSPETVSDIVFQDMPVLREVPLNINTINRPTRL